MHTKTNETTTTIRKTKISTTHAHSTPETHRKHSKTSTNTKSTSTSSTNYPLPSATYAKRTPLPPILPSLSPITTPKIFSRSRSVNRIGLSQSSSPIHPRTHSETNQVRNPLIGITLCTEPDPSKITDHQLKTILKPLSSFRYINEKNISNPYLFRDAAKVTTFVHAAGNRTRELWCFIQEASCADLRLAELEHSSLKKMLPFCRAGSRF